MYKSLIFVIFFGLSNIVFASGFKKNSVSSIYNIDVRRFVGEGDQIVQDLAKSVAAQISNSKIILSTDKIHRYTSQTIGDAFNLCLEEAFIDSPTLSDCTGTLIDKDVILTAKHCIKDEYDCLNKKWIFNFDRNKNILLNGTIDVNNEDVYQCKAIINGWKNSKLDYVFIKLDRKVEGADPLNLRKIPSLLLPKNLILIGTPLGMPLMYIDQFRIIKNLEDTYLLNTSTFSGNSGSPIIDLNTRSVIGVLTSGEKDFDFDIFSNCNRSKKCTENTCRGEAAVKSTSIIRPFIF